MEPWDRIPPPHPLVDMGDRQNPQSSWLGVLPADTLRWIAPKAGSLPSVGSPCPTSNSCTRRKLVDLDAQRKRTTDP